MKHVLIVGRGQIANALSISVWEHFPIRIWPGDIEELTSSEISSRVPLAIINAAGKTDLKWCEENALEAFRCNVSAPLKLLRAAQLNHVPLIHFSSGCVWDGPYKDGRGFTPEDPPTPASYYAWTKAVCDSMMFSEARTGINILRPRQVFSNAWTPRNTLCKLLKYNQLINTPNSMTSMETISQTVLALLNRPYGRCIWNIYDLGTTTPFRVGEMLAKAGLRDVPTELSKSDLDSWHTPRRVDTVLNDLWFEHYIKPRHVTTTLKDAIHDLATTVSDSLRHECMVG